MQTQRIEISRQEARKLYRKYKEHTHYSQPIDKEIMRAYQLMAQGRLVIKALESIASAGLNEQGWPKLAIARADADVCFCTLRQEGSCTMTDTNVWGSRRSNASTSRWFDWPTGTFKDVAVRRHKAEAMVPIVPLHLRPKRGFQNYHILWEADWTKMVPVDPFLLRRIGKGDLWAVLAMWDLTDVERAALAARVRH
jgi:hypothetical protein